LLFLSVIAGPFGIGLGAGSLLGGGLRIEVLAVGLVALANGIGCGLVRAAYRPR
jgi:hypothetical protein